MPNAGVQRSDYYVDMDVCNFYFILWHCVHKSLLVKIFRMVRIIIRIGYSLYSRINLAYGAKVTILLYGKVVDKINLYSLKV